MAQESRLGAEAQEGLEHGERQQLGVAELGDDPDPGPPLAQLGSHPKRVVDRHVQCSDKGVQVDVHETSKVELAMSNADLGRLCRVRRGSPLRRGPLESSV